MDIQNEQENQEDSNLSKSEQVEKEELTKKYYSKKKEIKEKLFSANKALEVSAKEAEEDLEKILSEEPDSITAKEAREYMQYVEKKKAGIKIEIEKLQAHENELELNYEDLKTEPKVDMLIDYEKTVNHAISINGPLMKMVFDYFNFLNDKKENQEKSKIWIDCFLDQEGYFIENFPHNTNFDKFTSSVMINFKNVVRVTITLKKFYDQSQGFVHKMGFISEGKTNLNPEYVSKKILFNAIAHSKIKGSYITMEAHSITWKQEKLEKRGFNDIFLPKSIMEDLRLYTTLFEKTGKILRYLMIGNPGTGKTESTIAIANVLNNRHVTVIKTMVCDALKEKIELAELLAPSLIIFDDIDLSLGSRKKGQFSSGLAQFLDVLDGTQKIRKDVGIIATTNSLELLDMAAQRPGRFDKLLAFDSLTKGNIRSIILKSLERNFDIPATSPEVEMFIHPEVVEKFHSAKVTGAHIYNTINMLKLRMQTLELEDKTHEWVLEEIKNELDTISRIRRTDYLQDKMNGNTSSGTVGFETMANNAEEEEYEEESPKLEAKGDGSFRKPKEGGSLNFQIEENVTERVESEGESYGNKAQDSGEESSSEEGLRKA